MDEITHWKINLQVFDLLFCSCRVYVKKLYMPRRRLSNMAY